MKVHCWSRRVRPFRWIWLAFLVSALGAFATPADAQVRPDTVRADTLPRDTLRSDSVRVAIPPESMVRDTLPADSARTATPDSLLPAPRLPELPQPFPTGFAAARWEWTREDLLRYHGLSLLELLERIPGLIVTRSGGFGRPAGMSFLGTGGGAVRLFRDGLEVDPLLSATLDLQEIGLADLQSLRVERTVGEIRIDLTTLQLEDRRPFSQVEAATGNYEAKILRAIFARPVGSRSQVTGAYDLTSTNGFTADEPYSFGSGRLRWTYSLSERFGLQAEFRQASIQREGSLFPEESRRRELVLRGRAQLFPGLTVDGLVARTSLGPPGSGASGDEFSVDEPEEDSLGLKLATTQAALRTGFQLGFGYLEATAQVRGGDPAGRLLPRTDVSIRGVVQPLTWFSLEGEARSVGMERGQATRMTGTARLGAIAGVSLFASVNLGERWAGTVDDTIEIRNGRDSVLVDGVRRLEEDTVTVPLFGSRRADAAGLRAGLEWSGWGARFGASYLSSAATVAVPHSLPFDRSVEPLAVGSASGVEAYASLPIPLWRQALRLDGMYVRWLAQGNRPYLPVEQARLALEFHRVFVEGQLEPTLRVEAVYRGGSTAPAADENRFGAVTGAYSMANLFLQIRILDIRAYLIFENFLNNRVAADVPGTNLAGPLLLYGIRWHFRN